MTDRPLKNLFSEREIAMWNSFAVAKAERNLRLIKKEEQKLTKVLERDDDN
jgi:hypothetical protein